MVFAMFVQRDIMLGCCAGGGGQSAKLAAGKQGALCAAVWCRLAVAPTGLACWPSCPVPSEQLCRQSKRTLLAVLGCWDGPDDPLGHVGIFHIF